MMLGFISRPFQSKIVGENDYENMHKAELETQKELLSPSMPTEQISMRFLPIHELEEVLKDYQYEKLYKDADPEFENKSEYIRSFFTKRNSPLAEEADFLVLMANKYQIDYRIVSAISIIESSGGTKLYRNYNAWGWGGAKGFHFDSWEHSIYVVSKGLGENYYARGANTPELIAPAYNPHTPNEWSAKVRMVMNQIGPEL